MPPRGRRAGDWNHDLDAARAGEKAMAATLAADGRISGLENHAAAFDRLDFRFDYDGAPVWLDLKEKRQPYSTTYGDLWPDRDRRDLFIVDELVYRRVVWQGGGGYLAIHDLPGGRWCLFGPWELTLGPSVRFERRGDRGRGEFWKGKILLDLAGAARQAPTFEVGDLLAVIGESRRALTDVRALRVGPGAVSRIG